jgi:putative endonuclease
MTLLSIFSTKKTGDDAERIAERFLTAQGLTLVTRNYRCRFGEIDLIMRHGETLVFVEVRMRKPLRGKADFGGALASITATKQAKLVATAQHYLADMKHPPPCRFDALLLNGLHTRDVEWLRNAFGA